MLRSWLKRRREELGISQEELAKIVQLKRQSIGQYENHQREVSIDLLRKLTVPLKFSLRITKGEIIIMEKQQTEQLDELRVFQAWRNEFRDYLKEQTSTSIKGLACAGIKLIRKHNLEVLNTCEEEDILLREIFENLIEDQFENLESRWAYHFVLTNLEIGAGEEGSYYYDTVRDIINSQVRIMEVVYFTFDVDLSLIEHFRREWKSNNISGDTLRNLFGYLPIKILSASTVFCIPEKQELKRES